MSVVTLAARRVHVGDAPAAAGRAYGMRLWIAVAVVVAVVLVSQGHNMLHYPYLEDDEGTYFSQAWAVFHLGRLAPYTYFYDHAPFGWIQIGVWQLLFGGVHVGYALASGRVLMLGYQVGSAILVLGIGRRLSGKVWVGLFAALVFTLSTYGIFYHRRILLDNIATFWLLLSLYMLTGRMTLRRVWISALAIGIAVLSKEVAVAAVPTLAILVARRAPRESRLFAVVGWLTVAISICSIYLLIALLKGELFPAGSLLGGAHPHVSLVCSLEWQAGRSADGGLLDPSSAFWLMARSWAGAEPLLVIGGTAAALICVVCLRRNAAASMLGWTVLALWGFLGRGGVVLVFYLVPLLPLLALALGAVLDAAVSAVRRGLGPRWGRAAVAGLLVTAVSGSAGLALYAYERANTPLWTGDPVTGQVAAVHWIEHNLSDGSRLVIDDYMWTDLHVPAEGKRAFRNAHYYWKVGDDPQVRDGVFKNSWRRVDYVISTPQLVTDTEQQSFPVVTQALEHSVLVKAFNTGGWEVDVRRVEPNARILLRLHDLRRQAAPPGCMGYGS